MLKKTIAYVDYNGVERKEDFYFNLTKAELMEKELTTVGGYADTVQKIIDTKDLPALIAIFKELILKAYGEKSADGKYFNKSEELSRQFSQTEAYSILFMELATEDKAAADFINEIVPSDIAKEAAKQTKKALANNQSLTNE